MKQIRGDSKIMDKDNEIKRLNELTDDEIIEWIEMRAKVGRERYQDAHLQRYGLVDIMEELADAHNIFCLLQDRIAKTIPNSLDQKHFMAIFKITNAWVDYVEAIKSFDALLPDSVCTDEKGGERIWWKQEAS